MDSKTEESLRAEIKHLKRRRKSLSHQKHELEAEVGRLKTNVKRWRLAVIEAKKRNPEDITLCLPLGR
jgi:predicted  nucleic acid-binding Zn-ribbon protein